MVVAQAFSPDAFTLSDDSDKVRLVWVPQAIGNMSAPLPWYSLPRKRQRYEGLGVGTMFLHGGCPGADCSEPLGWKIPEAERVLGASFL